jgi:protein O-GlcNAc transferase
VQALKQLRRWLGGASHNEADHASAMAAIAQEDWPAAKVALERCLLAQPGNLDTHLNLAFVSSQLGLGELVHRHAETVLRSRPMDADAHYLLGLEAERKGDRRGAEHRFEQAMHARPDFLPALSAHCRILVNAGEPGGALELLDRSRQRGVEGAELSRLRARVVELLGREAEALASWQSVLAEQPQDTEALRRLSAMAFLRHRPAEAAGLLERLVRVEPQVAGHWADLGNSLVALERFNEAVQAHRKAAALAPRDAILHAQRALALRASGQLSEALQAVELALSLDAKQPQVHVTCGLLRQELGQLTLARRAYEMALSLAPDDLVARSHYLFVLSVSEGVSADQYVEQARLYGQALTRQTASFPAFQHGAWRAAAKGLRIGFVSPDFRQHPVGRFLRDVLCHLPKGPHTWLGFTNASEVDELTEELRSCFDTWVSICGMPHQEAAQTIHRHQVDILIDLAGHTAGNSLGAMALRPASMQLGWLGFFASTGVEQIDAVLADEFCVPVGEEVQFTERVVRLPNLRYCFSRPPRHAGLEVRPAPILERGSWTFGTFQRSVKLNPKTLSAWRRVLQAVPRSRLRLQTPQADTDAGRKDLHDKLLSAGFDLAQIDLLPSAPWLDYLAAHHEVDFILDTFPFTGGTTTCEALWMGVPTLTWEGHSMLTRQGSSLMRVVGLEDWVCVDEDAFVARAIEICAKPEAFNELRLRLRVHAEASPLFDASRFAEGLVSTLESLWDESSCGEPNVPNGLPL